MWKIRCSSEGRPTAVSVGVAITLEPSVGNGNAMLNQVGHFAGSLAGARLCGLLLPVSQLRRLGEQVVQEVGQLPRVEPDADTLLLEKTHVVALLSAQTAGGNEGASAGQRLADGQAARFADHHV